MDRFGIKRAKATQSIRRFCGTLALTVLLSVCVPSPGLSAAPLLRLGSDGSEVVLAQHFLYQLGLLRLVPDGMFGPSTLEAVRQFQKERSLPVDGMIGPNTWSDLQKAVLGQRARIHVVQPGETLWGLAQRYEVPLDLLVGVNGIRDPSTIGIGQEIVVLPMGSADMGRPRSGGVELLHWSSAQELYSNFKVITVTDVTSGKSFKARRFYGHHHADSEPLSAEDARSMREIYGEWSWDRRPIIVEIDGRRIAASMNGVPHGQGAISDNDFGGHFCIHFLGSRIHRTGKIDIRHQTAVLEAAGYAVTDLWLAHK